MKYELKNSTVFERRTLPKPALMWQHVTIGSTIVDSAGAGE